MSSISFRSFDVEDANAKLNEVFFESRFEPARDAPARFRMDMKFDVAGPVTYAMVSHGCEIVSSVGGRDMTYSLAVPLEGVFPIQFGPHEVMADPNTAVVTTPSSRFTYRGFHAGTERLIVLAFEREQLELHLGRLLGNDRAGSIDFAHSLDIRRGVGAQWWRMTSSVLPALHATDSLLSNPMVAASFSSTVMTGLLLATDHRYRDELASWTRPVPPIMVRRAAEIIESRANEALTIPEIAAELGCSVRALQAGYRNHLGMTPREHLGRVRMERAHAMLQFANPGSATVAGIAATWGFRQPGRFAGEYRKIYGVSPYATLREG